MLACFLLQCLLCPARAQFEDFCLEYENGQCQPYTEAVVNETGIIAVYTTCSLYLEMLSNTYIDLTCPVVHANLSGGATYLFNCDYLYTNSLEYFTGLNVSTEIHSGDSNVQASAVIPRDCVLYCDNLNKYDHTVMPHKVYANYTSLAYITMKDSFLYIQRAEYPIELKIERNCELLIQEGGEVISTGGCLANDNLVVRAQNFTADKGAGTYRLNSVYMVGADKIQVTYPTKLLFTDCNIDAVNGALSQAAFSILVNYTEYDPARQLRLQNYMGQTNIYSLILQNVDVVTSTIGAMAGYGREVYCYNVHSSVDLVESCDSLYAYSSSVGVGTAKYVYLYNCTDANQKVAVKGISKYFGVFDSDIIIYNVPSADNSQQAFQGEVDAGRQGDLNITAVGSKALSITGPTTGSCPLSNVYVSATDAVDISSSWNCYGVTHKEDVRTGSWYFEPTQVLFTVSERYPQLFLEYNTNAVAHPHVASRPDHLELDLQVGAYLPEVQNTNYSLYKAYVRPGRNIKFSCEVVELY